MTEETKSTETNDTTETTTETSSVETQQVSTQDTQQEDTIQRDDKVTETMGIKEKEESSETESRSLPSIDSIVAEAMSGEISEETQKVIEANGLQKHLDLLVAGHKAIQEKNNVEIFDTVGGEKSYSELQEWGMNNLSKEEKEAFNEALFSGNMHMAKLAVQGLQARYVSKNGRPPERVIEGEGTVNADSRPFSNVSEYLKEARTTKYKRDPEYRAQVEAKRNKSGF